MSPHSSDSTSTATQLAKSRSQCRRISRSHYENFLVGSLLLPRKMRQPFFDIYAFCRTADDLADESPSPARARESLNGYRDCISRIFDNRSVSGIFVALADTIRTYQLPRAPFDDLLDAFLQDQATQRYPDEESLLQYCNLSANPVGRLVLALAGSDSKENVQLSDEICTALQLANFWQDVARDFAIGRIYIPETTMVRHGFDHSLIDQTIQSAAATPKCVRDAIAELCEQTRTRFERGRALPDRIPQWLAADVEMFLRGGLATLDAITRIKFDVLRHRPTVGKMTQVSLLARTAMRRFSIRRHRYPSHDRTMIASEGSS
ncbi:squalene synthase HpnC [Rhodopirellula rubra]|uniref:Squalene synthase HpnC n=1 Tax=Aporhodopirellula rubra TaxID=980271 RepID=A0A7W5E2S9_9BACT|nr:squalene synthase HpnC [Aporhodopirellula rubra]MBB3208528.1 squalene synthase HpnC [Aporhodopirellula rubra]